MRETWYILENGVTADPNEVSFDENGLLRHKSGVAVAYGPHGPRSTGVDVDQERKRASDSPVDRELTSEKPKATYRTRSAKGA